VTQLLHELVAVKVTGAKTVLVADDTAFVRDRFKTALEAAGHRAITVGTGGELLAELRNDVPIDLIVLDLQLPQSAGVELLRTVRSVGRQRPVVVFSGTIPTAEDVRKLGALGVAGYVNEYMASQHIMPALAPHLFPDNFSRRANPRVSVAIAVAYRFGNTIATATMLNVSHGGLAIRTTTLLEPGADIKVHFRLPGASREIDAGARIRWADRRFGMGAEFITIDDASQQAIDEFVLAHFFSNRKA
jgi:uncharacterized protein (TIGR02266 family)